ncbi:GGDEF domain-containing protein [Lachnospiraceae bacterium OttesenSCG-928-E19]|nr:GGDEF domain-containing protein [Lachnospiraceae bacterium OttesenSCG-928-E19]
MTDFDGHLKSFWISIMDQINNNDSTPGAASKIMGDIRAFFHFDFSFIYHANYTGELTLDSSSSSEDSNVTLPASINFKEELDPSLLNQLSGEKVITFINKKTKDDLEKALSNLFQSSSLILIPIVNDDGILISVLGLTNHLPNPLHENINISFAYAILVVIANHIRTYIYHHQAELAKNALQNISDNMGVDIYVNDFYTHEVLYANASMAAPYGSVNEMIGSTCWKFLYKGRTQQCEYCPQFKIVDEDGNPTKIYSWNYERPFDHSWFRVLSSAFEWNDGRIAHLVSSVDITENIQSEQTVQRLAETDALTGLPNRRKLFSDSEGYIKENPAAQNLYAIFFDLDKFKPVNDIYGHRTGDDLLKAIGSFLATDELTKGRSYRYGGDEFIILCKDTPYEDVLKIAQHLTEHFSKPWCLSDCQPICPTSIGIAQYGDETPDAESLFSNADSAMYASKKDTNCKIHFYNNGKSCPIA